MGAEINHKETFVLMFNMFANFLIGRYDSFLNIIQLNYYKRQLLLTLFI